MAHKVIRKANGYEVRSEKGRRLGKNLSKAGAKRRLRQVEMFKHMRKGGRSPKPRS